MNTKTPPHSAPPTPPPRGTDAAPAFDPAIFTRLLTLAGPDFAAELVARYHADLAQVQAQLRAALPPQNAPDWPTLAHASHVLIALAGTAGATALETTARHLNHAATAQNPTATRAHHAKTLHGLAHLITFITQITPQGHTPP